jgi:glycosyltransferase involved in cell wall biosynthesis
MALGVATAVGLGSLLLHKFMIGIVNEENYPVTEPPFTSIVMCTLNEEKFIEDALISLGSQNIICKYPKSFEFIVVDSHSEDNTAAIAEDYGWKVIQAQRGKLNARHKGMFEAKGTVVVSVDADTFYPRNWLNLMLQWFKRPDVVGVVGPRLVDPAEGAWATYASVMFSLFDVGPLLAGGMRMPGQSVAFYRQAYFDVGGFDLAINQQDMHEMVREEEIRFAFKLRRLGRVIVDWRAPCFTSARRTMLVGKGDKYLSWRKERQSGARF